MNNEYIRGAQQADEAPYDGVEYDGDDLHGTRATCGAQPTRMFEPHGTVGAGDAQLNVVGTDGRRTGAEALAP